MPANAEARGARPRLALAAGAFGLLVALAGALGLRAPVPPGAYAALVGERTITEADLARALSALEADKRQPLTANDRAFALERLIEEELLFQRAEALGLAREDPAARKALVQAMVEVAMLSGAAREPSEAQLQRFHAERPQLFAAGARVQLKAAVVANAPDAIAAFQVDLAQGFDAAAAKAAPAPLPRGWLGRQDAASLLGAAAADAALAGAAGAVIGPIAQGRLAVFVHVVARQEGEALAFASVRDAVAAEWRRRAEEEALSAYLDDLKRRSRIVRAQSPPP